MNMQHIKLLGANAASWVATIISVQFVKDALQIIALVGSIAVSAASIWWVHRQARSLDRKDRQKP